MKKEFLYIFAFVFLAVNPRINDCSAMLADTSVVQVEIGSQCSESGDCEGDCYEACKSGGYIYWGGVYANNSLGLACYCSNSMSSIQNQACGSPQNVEVCSEESSQSGCIKQWFCQSQSSQSEFNNPYGIIDLAKAQQLQSCINVQQQTSSSAGNPFADSSGTSNDGSSSSTVSSDPFSN